MKNEKFAATLSVGDAAYTYYPVEQVEGSEKLPYALKVLLENVLRNAESPQTASDLAKRVVEAGCAGEVGSEVEFSPARVLFQDFTGVPVFVDFAVMREACANAGRRPGADQPAAFPATLVIDHSVIADVAGLLRARMEKNMRAGVPSATASAIDFLKWAQKSFQNVRIVPPGAGICHQLNIEQFAQVAMTYHGRAGAETPEGETPRCTSTRWWAPTATRLPPTASACSAGASAVSRPRPRRWASPITTLVPQGRGRAPDGRAAPRASRPWTWR